MSVPTDPSGQTSGDHGVSVDLSAFLPDGVELAAADEAVPSAGSDGVATSPWRPDLAGLEGVEADLDAVDASLRALDDATYGTCTACGQPIDDVDLAAVPTRTTCAAHTSV